jgi:hypothetical protein
VLVDDLNKRIRTIQFNEKAAMRKLVTSGIFVLLALVSTAVVAGTRIVTLTVTGMT